MKRGKLSLRSVSRIKILFILLSVAIATVAMALPVCASTPLPTSTSSPVYPTHIDAALELYYIKFSHDWTSYTADKYISTDGTVNSYTGQNFRLSPLFTLSADDKMICPFNSYNNSFPQIVSITFYNSNLMLCDSSYNYCISSPTTQSGRSSWSNIPPDARYFRLAIRSNYTSAMNRIKTLISPEVVAFSNNRPVDNFWRGYLSVQNYMIYENGVSAFTMTADAAFDAVYAEITVSSSYHIASYVSCDVYTTVKDGGYDNNFYPVEYNDRDEREALPRYATLRPFYIDALGAKVYPDSFDVGSELFANPATLFCYSPDNLISGFNIEIPLNAPTGLTANSVVNVEISNIAFDDMSVVIPEWSISTVNQIENAVASAEVPVPSFDLGDIVVNAISNVDFNAANNLFGWFWGVSIVASMTALVGMFCLIGYVFFGKKG